MATKKTVEAQKASATAQAKEILDHTIASLTELDRKSDAEKRLFFPNGIELISITVGVQNLVTLGFEVAGAAGVSGESIQVERLIDDDGEVRQGS